MDVSKRFVCSSKILMDIRVSTTYEQHATQKYKYEAIMMKTFKDIVWVCKFSLLHDIFLFRPNNLICSHRSYTCMDE